MLVRLEENEDGRLVPAPERYAAVPSEDYDLQMEGRCFYLNQAADTMNDPQYFWRHMEAGDSQTYTMVFAVDEDLDVYKRQGEYPGSIPLHDAYAFCSR